MLLLLVGDGIQEGVEQLTDTLSRSPQLGFSFGLVELATYRFGEPAKTLVLPRLIARTREIVRAVVEVRLADGRPQVEVTLPELVAKPSESGQRRRLTEEVLIEQIRSSVGPEMSARFDRFIERAEQLGIQPEGRDTSLSLFWQEPETERRFTFGSVYNDGRAEFRFVLHYFRKAGIDSRIGQQYISAVAGLIVGGAVATEKKPSGEYADIRVAGKPARMTDLLARSDEWLSTIEEFMRRVQKAAETVAE